MKKGLVLVSFDAETPSNTLVYDEVLSGEKLKSLIDPGSIYEATEFLEELPKLKLPDGTSITQSLMYEGYELWWIHNTDIFRYFCLPYTQYKRLLEYLRSFQSINLSSPPFESLFRIYLEAYGCKVEVTKNGERGLARIAPFGVLIQLFLTLISLPVLIAKKFPILIYTGDKFEKDRDYDFRMKFVYQELRERKLPFMEFIRGIEPWRAVISHAWTRKRAALYSEAVIFVSRFLGFLSGRRSFASTGNTPEYRFKLAVATQYVETNEDVWAVRIMKVILSAIQVKAAFIPAASERSWHTLIAAKLNNIPTVGIMHGVQSRYYNTYDFLTGYRGDKHLGVDRFGVWSDWWMKYYTENSNLYTSEHLFVSGPMRPLVKDGAAKETLTFSKDFVRVLFVSEEMAVPQEVLPYLYELLKHKDIKVTLKFRPYRDGFENWLKANKPEMLTLPELTISRESMQDAIKGADVAVGCQSTGVIEMLFQLKVPIYFRTQKWGDYYNLENYNQKTFLAETPGELVEKIRGARNVSLDTLKDLQERFFGDPYKNGSKWVVDSLVAYLQPKDGSSPKPNID